MEGGEKEESTYQPSPWARRGLCASCGIDSASRCASINGHLSPSATCRGRSPRIRVAAHLCWTPWCTRQHIIFSCSLPARRRLSCL